MSRLRTGRRDCGSTGRVRLGASIERLIGREPRRWLQLLAGPTGCLQEVLGKVLGGQARYETRTVSVGHDRGVLDQLDPSAEARGVHGVNHDPRSDAEQVVGRDLSTQRPLAGDDQLGIQEFVLARFWKVETIRSCLDSWSATLRAEAMAVANYAVTYLARLRLGDGRPYVEPTGYRRVA